MAKNDMDKFRQKLKKVHGSKLTSYQEDHSYVTTSTGSIALDVALGTGGWVQGRLHEITGVQNVGKSSLMLASIAEQQLAYPEKAVAYIDMEQTFAWDWAEKFGVNLSDDNFIHIYPDNAEDVSDIVRDTAASGLVSAIVVDSIGGMESQKAFEKDAADVVMGKNAMVITRMVKHAAMQAQRNKVTILLVNQLRANIGSMTMGDISAGPKALAYANSIKVKMGRGGDPPKKVRINGSDVVVGHQIKAKVEKNKVAAQGRVASFYLITEETEKYGPVGIDRIDEAVNVGIMTGVIEQRGAWYTLPNGTRIQSRDSVVEALNEDISLAHEVRTAALKSLKEYQTPGEGSDDLTIVSGGEEEVSDE